VPERVLVGGVPAVVDSTLVVWGGTVKQHSRALSAFVTLRRLPGDLGSDRLSVPPVATRVMVLATVVCLSSLAVPGVSGCASADTVSTQKQWPVSRAIRSAALADTSAGKAHALPLAGHWNTGTRRDGFDPSYQLQEIKNGRYLLPWIDLIPPNYPVIPSSYYAGPVKTFAEQRLPISFVSTQWEVLVEQALREAGTAEARAMASPLSPFSPRELWYEAGLKWGRHPFAAADAEALSRSTAGRIRIEQ